LCASELLAEAGLPLAPETIATVRFHSALKALSGEERWKRIVLRFASRRQIVGIALGLDVHVAGEQHLGNWPLVMHELTHVAQYIHQGVPSFLSRYSVDYLRGRWNGKDDYRAYLDLSAEAQARSVEAAAHHRVPSLSPWMVACS
jgi:hypothetical protein